MSQLPAAGDKAPDFQLEDVYGKKVRLGQFAGRTVILEFIGHLGCLHCRAHLTRLRQQYGKIQHYNGEVVVISFEPAQGIKQMVAGHKFPFVFLLDPEKTVYKQYQMLRPEKGSVANWRTVFTQIQLRLAGYPKYPRGSDVRQMGGDVIVDPQGVVRFIHRSRFPQDRPSVSEMMKIVTAISGKKP